MIFLCTAIALVSLICMTNWLFDFYLLPSGFNICNNGTTGGFVLAGFLVVCCG